MYEISSDGLGPYDREAAVRYAHRWAYGRNPAFYDYEFIGGDCTNFASQCVFAGSGVMNYLRDFGWYYIDADEKAPAWTGVPYFYNFMTRSARSRGPVAVDAAIGDIRRGDVIQLSFDGRGWHHAPVVVGLLRTPALKPGDILVAAHSYDADNRPLDTYSYLDIRFLHFIGVRG